MSIMCNFVLCQETVKLIQFYFRKLQEEYSVTQKKLCMCYVDLKKKTFDIVPRIVMEWSMRKKGIQEALVRAVISLYEGVNTTVKVGTHSYEGFDVNVGVHQRSVLFQLVFAILIDVSNEKKVGMSREIMYPDD